MYNFILLKHQIYEDLLFITHFAMLILQSCGVKQPVQMSGNPLLKDGMPIQKVSS